MASSKVSQHAADGRFARVVDAVVVGVEVYVAADAGRLHFGEIVVNAVVAAIEVYAAEDVDRDCRPRVWPPTVPGVSPTLR